MMKKNKKLLLIALCMICAPLLCTAEESCMENQCCTTFDLTTGYVFKHDCNFKSVYGHGIQNIITADACYYWCESWGLGAKVSYWQAKGCTTLFKQRTHLHEIPLTFYVRKSIDCSCLQLYGSVGGGAMFIKEKSYLGCVKETKGVGELEIGAYYDVCSCFDITAAFRYLFPHECVLGKKVDIGGFDLRAGIGFSY